MKEIQLWQNVDDEKLNINLVKERLMSEEAKLSESVDDKTAFPSNKLTNKKKFKGKCFKCHKFGHQAKDCWQSEARAASSKAVSFMIKRKDADDRYVDGKINFKLDSGASDHLAKDKSYFSTMKKLDDPIEINVAKNNQSIFCKLYWRNKWN